MNSGIALHRRKVVWRSGLVLLVLYVVYGAVALPFVLAGATHWPWIFGLATLLPLNCLVFSYWFSPVLITCLTKVTWTGEEILPDQCQTFLKSLCSSNGIKNLRVGIVETSVPNAFVYGRRRTPRLVFTRGMLKQLPADELKAVIAHEVGHLRRRDFLILAIAMVVPMIFFRLGWAMFLRGGNSNAGLAIRALGMVLLSLYWISKFVYLVLSRAREFYADAFSAEATKDPDSLARALVRITYEGSLQQAALDQEVNGANKTTRKAARREETLLRPVSALAIHNLSRRWMPLSTSSDTYSQVGQLMLWDVTNPWALLHQTASSHPLTTFRIARLNRFTREMGLLPSVIVPTRGKRPWGRFVLDICAYLAPYAGLALSFLGFPVLFLVGSTFRLWYRYHGKERVATSADLIGRVDASPMNPLRVRMYGTLEPGDRFGVTGAVLFDGRDAIPVKISAWSMVARLRLSSLTGKRVVVSGWYRRGDAPWIEPLRIEDVDGQVIRARTRIVKLIVMFPPGWAVLAALVGRSL